MTRQIAVLALFLLIGVSVSSFSQEAPTLTPDQQQQFDSQKLTVTGYRIITVTRFGSSDSGFGPSSTNWEAAKGYEKISEPDFLRTIGLDKEALDSQSNLSRKSALTWGGVGLAVVGLAVMVYPLLSPPMTTDAYGYSSIDLGTEFAIMGVGAAIGLGGTVMLLVGEGVPSNITPFGRAQGLADKYNTQLLIKIKGSDKPNEYPSSDGST